LQEPWEHSGKRHTTLACRSAIDGDLEPTGLSPRSKVRSQGRQPPRFTTIQVYPRTSRPLLQAQVIRLARFPRRSDDTGHFEGPLPGIFLWEAPGNPAEAFCWSPANYYPAPINARAGFYPSRPHWRSRTNNWRGRTSPGGELRRLTGGFHMGVRNHVDGMRQPHRARCFDC
jgi:hypothetical protein